MRTCAKHLTKFRVRFSQYASDDSFGMQGAFQIPRGGIILRVVSSDGSGWTEQGLDGTPWEHVSVSTEHRCPRWEEMEFVRHLFWSEDETVIQFHVPAADHVNIHDHVLHLWRPIGISIPRPPKQCV